MGLADDCSDFQGDRVERLPQLFLEVIIKTFIESHMGVESIADEDVLTKRRLT